MIRSVIVENEKKHFIHLSDMLMKYFPEITIEAHCETANDAIAKINSLNPDLLFMDVELEPYTAFDILEKIQSGNFNIVFTTSHSKYALRAFDFCALDYLVKPYGIDELKRAVNRYKEKAQPAAENDRISTLLRNLKQNNIDELEIFIPVKNGEVKLKLGEIICCCSSGSSITFSLTGGENFSISKPLNWLEERLHGFNFFRIHDSYLVNMRHVKRINHVRDGAELILSENNKTEVSKRRKSSFLNAIASLNALKSV
ncbi:MAG: response regulator transcription factor [Bacteroidetes bacterium]|nr:response regulator transcription factor [Bacteroidota bacterium]